MNPVAMSSLAELGARGENLSIVIPTYNCAQYLEETLRSLKAQPGGIIDDAQIKVVDDCSTKDDPEKVCRKVWGDRVEFYRHQENVGPCANFNASLGLAEREWIHLLHGDDFVLAGAYEEFRQCIRENPDVLAVFARSVLVNAAGRWTGVSPGLGPGWRGRLEYTPVMWSANPVMFPGVLLSREVVSTVGHFDDSFCHVQDWNMWWRIARTGRVAYTNRCIGAYREFQGNHTSTLVESGKNLSEIMDQVDRVVESTRGHASPSQTLLMYESPFQSALSQCWFLNGQSPAFGASFQIFQRFPTDFRRRNTLRILKLRHFENLIRRKLSLTPKKFVTPRQELLQ